jgi:hypothetical protein
MTPRILRAARLFRARNGRGTALRSPKQAASSVGSIGPDALMTKRHMRRHDRREGTQHLGRRS